VRTTLATVIFITMSPSRLIIERLEPIHSVHFQLVFSINGIELVIVNMPSPFCSLSMSPTFAPMNIRFRD
jgi:hypothetical protein